MEKMSNAYKKYYRKWYKDPSAPPLRGCPTPKKNGTVRKGIWKSNKQDSRAPVRSWRVQSGKGHLSFRQMDRKEAVGREGGGRSYGGEALALRTLQPTPHPARGCQRQEIQRDTSTVIRKRDKAVSSSKAYF